MATGIIRFRLIEKTTVQNELTELFMDEPIEATFLDRDAAIARDYGHLTAAEAAALAAASDVKLLVLTHISGRYTDEEILAETRKTFPNSRVAIDFDRILI
jgi:ribonuclease Z